MRAVSDRENPGRDASNVTLPDCDARRAGRYPRPRSSVPVVAPYYPHKRPHLLRAEAVVPADEDGPGAYLVYLEYRVQVRIANASELASFVNQYDDAANGYRKFKARREHGLRGV